MPTKNRNRAPLGLLSSLEKIEEQGGDLVISLDAPNADLPLIPTDYPDGAAHGRGPRRPLAAIGTGPQADLIISRVRAAFQKNADDWRSDRGFVDTFEMIAMNDATARVAALSRAAISSI